MKLNLEVELAPTGKMNGKQDKEILKATVPHPDGVAYVTFYRNVEAVKAAPKEVKATAPVVRKAGKAAETAPANPLAGIDPAKIAAIAAALKAAGL